MLQKIKIIFFFTIFSISGLQVFAVRATPEPILIIQPDGSRITVYLRGDESFHYHTTTDGVPVKANSMGVFHYAGINGEGELELTAIKANNPELRTASEKAFAETLAKTVTGDFTNLRKSRQKSPASIAAEKPLQRFPATGSPKSLVILVNFRDKSFVVSDPQTTFSNLLNQQGYNTYGSARDYFRDASSGAFDPEFVVAGPYTLPQTLAYYGKNTDGEDDSERLQQFVIDACTQADNAGVDFSQYDTDGDGFMDNVFIYYAGYNEAENAPENTIWPHRWAVTSNKFFDGKRIGDYACTSELRGSSGRNMCGIGTFVHEFGHVLGLPDLYATNTSEHNTMGRWDVMDYGPYNNSGRTPPTYSAYERFFMGWLIPVEISTRQTFTLQSLTASNRAFLVSKEGNHNLNGTEPSPREFFMLENRQKTGWDAYIPGHGLLVTRIFFRQSRWDNNEVNNDQNEMGVQIISADEYMSTDGDSGDPFPGTENITVFLPVLRDGASTDKPLTDIKENNSIVSFNFMDMESMPAISENSSFLPFETEYGTASEIQTFTVNGKNLISPVNISFAQNLHFEFKTETGSEWTKSLILEPQNSTIENTVIQVRYNPLEPSGTDVHAETIVLSSTYATDVKIDISGTSIYTSLVPPVANEARQITGNSFVANWETVRGASGYYLTVYSMADGESSQTEGFNQGLLLPYGWSTNSSSMQNAAAYCGAAPPAIQLRSTNEFLQTEKYNRAAKSLSVTLKAVEVSFGSCILYVKAWNESSYVSIDTVILGSAYSETLMYNFAENDNFTSFRFEFETGRAAGNVAIDDIKVTFDKAIGNIISGKWITVQMDTIKGLTPSTDYYYKVQASNKTQTSEYSVTNYSNIIHVKTGVITDTTSQSDTPETIYIYSVNGQMLDKYQGQAVDAGRLPAKQVLIIKKGNKITKVMKNF